MKIIDKINSNLEQDKTGKRTFYSYEYFPARTEAGKHGSLLSCRH